MPTPFVKKIAEDKGKPVSEIEALWTKAKAAAAKEGHAEDYAYITGIFKRMAGVEASLNVPMTTKMPQYSTLAAVRIQETANSEQVRNLAVRVFGPNVQFDPPQSVMITSGEPILFVTTEKPYNLRQLMFFSRALDRSTQKFRVNYVMPDVDRGPNTMRVSFFKGMRPTR